MNITLLSAAVYCIKIKLTIKILYISSILSSSLLFCFLLFSPLFFAPLLFYSFLLFSPLFFSSILFSPLLFSTLLFLLFHRRRKNLVLSLCHSLFLSFSYFYLLLRFSPWFQSDGDWFIFDFCFFIYLFTNLFIIYVFNF